MGFVAACAPGSGEGLDASGQPIGEAPDPGDEPTLADLSVAAMTMYLGPVGFPWQRFPAFTRWCRRIESTPEWATTAIGPWA